MTEQELLNTLEFIRCKKELNVETFAPLIGLSKSVYYRWLRGESIPQIISSYLLINQMLKEEGV